MCPPGGFLPRPESGLPASSSPVLGLMTLYGPEELMYSLKCNYYLGRRPESGPYSYLGPRPESGPVSSCLEAFS